MLDAKEFTESVRFRLECARPTEPIVCTACNSGLLDAEVVHASCCALGAATLGHNAVANLIHEAGKLCHLAAETEVLSQSPGTGLRPAGVVVTSAMGNCHTALDFSSCSPCALEGGLDCNQSKVEAELGCYGPHFPALPRHNIEYTLIM